MSEQYRVSVVFEGRDNISDVARDIAGKMDDVSKASSKFAGALADVGKIAGGVVASLVGFNILGEVRRFAEDATRAFMEFEQASIKLAALAREAGQDVNLLAGAFRMVASAAAREFAVSGQEAISALESLVKAGLSGRDAVQALGQVIMLAKTEGADFATAANAVVQVMAQFGLTGAEAARAVDALTNASRLGIGSAVDFANGLANVGATARAMGMSLEDATSWLVVLERRFGNAQEAGTHLNRFLLELYDIASKLGVPIRDVEGNLRAVNAIILDVIATVKQSGLSFADLQDKLKGVDMRALKTLFTIAQMTENIDELRAAVGRGGSAMEAFAAVMETTAGRFQLMQSEVDRLQRNIGEKFGQMATMLGSVFLPAVNAAVTAWTGIISWATGNVAGQIQSQIEAWLMLGKVTKEQAAEIIVANIEMGRISVQEGLKIAEIVGVTSNKLLEMAGVSVEAAEGIGEVGSAAGEAASKVQDMAKKIEESNNLIHKLASTFKLSENTVVDLINTMFNLNITYDEHAGLVQQLMNTYGLTEQQARQLIDALIKESEAQQTAAQAAKQHEEAVKRATEALNQNLETLMNYGQIQGPLSSAINSVRDAINTLGDTLSIDFKNKLDEALLYFEDLNNKFILLETNLKQVKAATDIAGIGISYYNTLTSISSALIIDETLALDAKIRKIQDEIKALEERKKQTPSYADAIQKQIDAHKQLLTVLQEEKNQLQQSIALTDEQVATQARLKAIQDTLSFTTQQLTLMQTGLQLAMMGATETGWKFMNAILELTDAQMDGIVTEKEMMNVLKQLGVTFDEAGKPIINLKGFLAAFKNEFLANMQNIEAFREKLKSLDNMTVHTYHYHHQITIAKIIHQTGGKFFEEPSSGEKPVTTGGGGGEVKIIHKTGGRFFEYQRGTTFVPFTGPAILHRGEMVLPRDLADLIREGGLRFQGVNVQVYVDASKVSDPEEVARLVSRELVRRLRAM
jgi:TP901 family phage tail tape measure protein